MYNVKFAYLILLLHEKFPAIKMLHCLNLMSIFPSCQHCNSLLNIQPQGALLRGCPHTLPIIPWLLAFGERHSRSYSSCPLSSSSSAYFSSPPRRHLAFQSLIKLKAITLLNEQHDPTNLLMYSGIRFCKHEWGGTSAKICCQTLCKMELTITGRDINCLSVFS